MRANKVPSRVRSSNSSLAESPSMASAFGTSICSESNRSPLYVDAFKLSPVPRARARPRPRLSRAAYSRDDLDADLTATSGESSDILVD